MARRPGVENSIFTLEKYFTRLVREALEEHLTAVIDRESYRISRNLSTGIAAAARKGTVGATGGVKVFAEGVKRNFGNPKDMEVIHSEVAAQMRESVHRSFGRTVRTRSGPYRVGGAGAGPTKGGFLMRYSGGSLRRAVSSPQLAVGTAHGISYVDEGRLTKEAAHWARLNFGAKGYAVAGRRKTSYRFIFDERVVGTIGFENDSRPAFMLPPGVWRSGNEPVAPNRGHAVGQDAFFLAPTSYDGPLGSASVYNRETKRFEAGRKKIKTGLHQKRTRGIRPKGFLDAGLYTMAKELPVRYERVMDSWLKEAEKAALLPERIVARPGRPDALPVRRGRR